MPTIVKRKKKKTKKSKAKLEKENEELNEDDIKRRKSCHFKCKEDYETEKNSVSTKGAIMNLQYGPNYQGAILHKSVYMAMDSMQKRSNLKHKIDIVIFSNQPYMSLQNSIKKPDSNRSKSRKSTQKNKSSSKNGGYTTEQTSQRSSGNKDKNLSKRTISSKMYSGKPKSSNFTGDIIAPRYSEQKGTPAHSRGSIPMSAELLYMQGLERISSRDKIAAENKLRKEQEELRACTFQPNILGLSRKKSLPE